MYATSAEQVLRCFRRWLIECTQRAARAPTVVNRGPVDEQMHKREESRGALPEAPVYASKEVRSDALIYHQKVNTMPNL